MSIELFKLILDKDFYLSNKHRIKKELFPTDVHPLVEVAISLQETQLGDYKLADVWEMFKAQNPVLTNSTKEKYYEIINTIKNSDTLSEVVAEEVLRKAWRSHTLNQTLEAVLLINENRSEDWEQVEKLIKKAKDGYIKEEVDSYIEPDLSTLLDEDIADYKWRFNYDGLGEQIGGIGPALFTIIAARPDVGKTLAWVSFVFGKGGFIDQGAKVHILCNEEPASRTFLRGVCARVGYPISYIRKHREQFEKEIAALKGKVFIKDIVNYTIADIERYCEDKEIDILIIDQMDKIGGISADGSDPKTLQILYERVRTIGKKYELAPIAITQASAAAHGRLYFGYECLNNSKTGKAGEADIIICIGMKEATEEDPDIGYRVLNIPKNKSPTGSKLPVSCYFNRDLSRIQNERQTTTSGSQPR